MKYISTIFLIVASCQYMSEHPQLEKDLEGVGEVVLEEGVKVLEAEVAK